jgi:hypothetical protein
MFDIRYQLRLHDLYDMVSSSYTTYVMTQQHLRTLEMIFVGETPIRFNRNSNKLFIDWDWTKGDRAGQWIIVEGFIALNHDEYPDVYNDRLLKKLATAHVKKTWGTNMNKFQGIEMLGGKVLNGGAIYSEAVEEPAPAAWASKSLRSWGLSSTIRIATPRPRSP